MEWECFMEGRMFGRRSTTAFSFERDEHASVIVIFLMMSAALLLAAGTALDYARVSNMREGIQAAVRSASEAAAKALRRTSLSDDEVKAVALSHFEKGVVFARQVGTIDAPTVSIDRSADTVTVGGKGTVSMTVSRLRGVEDIAVPATSTAGQAR
jgi:hypothetical protein